MSDRTNDEKRTNADGSSVSQPIAKPNVVCSLLSHDKEFLKFGLQCYNDGLYDGQCNLKGGESILQKFHAFLKSLSG